MLMQVKKGDESVVIKNQKKEDKRWELRKRISQIYKRESKGKRNEGE